MFRIYQVLPEETLEEIAQKFGTTTKELERINGWIGEQQIKPNDNIIIPNVHETPFKIYTVKQGENIYNIAKRLDVNYKDLLKLNGLEENDYIYPNQELLIPNENISFYITNEGDTIRAIAQNLNTTPQEAGKENDNLYIVPNQLAIHKKERI